MSTFYIVSSKTSKTTASLEKASRKRELRIITANPNHFFLDETTAPQKEFVPKLIKQLGDFPIIIKVLGGSHGVGVMRIDSIESFYSVSDFLKQSNIEVALKEYVPARRTARLMVLGDRVIDSIEYIAPKRDFRSNEGAEPNVIPKVFSKEVNNMAVKAVSALNLDFGGVDIAITDKDIYVLEVNFPAFYPRCEMITGTDISAMIIEYLLNKAQK